MTLPSLALAYAIDAGTVNGRPTIITLPAGTANGRTLSLHTTNSDVTAALA